MVPHLGHSVAVEVPVVVPALVVLPAVLDIAVVVIVVEPLLFPLYPVVGQCEWGLWFLAGSVEIEFNAIEVMVTSISILALKDLGLDMQIACVVLSHH